MATHEALVALHVTDEEGYQRYRDGMTPLLEGYGGRFRWDFRVSEVLENDGEKRLNRLFILSFPDARTKEAFFSDPGYLAVRAEHFDGSVGAVERIAEYSVT